MITILIIGAIAFLLLFLFKKRPNSTEDNNKSISNENRTSNPSKPVALQNPAGSIYKTKGIKRFAIKGTYYRDINPEKHNGSFRGYVKCEYNPHDESAVAIYNNMNEHLGFTPKGNKRLNNSLLKWHNGQLIAWGSLEHNDFNDRWDGVVFIPVGMNNHQIGKLALLVDLTHEIHGLFCIKHKSSYQIRQILELHRNIITNQAELKNPEGIFYAFPKNLVPSISKHFEKEQEWQDLLELETHQDLISTLSPTFKEATIKRIEKARESISKTNR